MSLNEAGHAPRYEDTDIENMNMDQLKTRLCAKSRGDINVCNNCDPKCAYGKQAIKQMKGTTHMQTMSKKQQYLANQTISAMENYLEAMKETDPVQFVLTKYGVRESQAKNKLYQWRHNYGSNMNIIAYKILEMKNELAAAEAQTNENPSEDEEPLSESEKKENSLEQKKINKRTKEKISKDQLSTMREDLENEFLSLSKKIEDYKKEIEACENRMTEITDEISAVRRVLDIFKKKDEKYVQREDEDE